MKILFLIHLTCPCLLSGKLYSMSPSFWDQVDRTCILPFTVVQRNRHGELYLGSWKWLSKRWHLMLTLIDQSHSNEQAYLLGGISYQMTWKWKMETTSELHESLSFFTTYYVSLVCSPLWILGLLSLIPLNLSTWIMSLSHNFCPKTHWC